MKIGVVGSIVGATAGYALPRGIGRDCTKDKTRREQASGYILHAVPLPTPCTYTQAITLIWSAARSSHRRRHQQPGEHSSFERNAGVFRTIIPGI
jgi:hypothetical protein